MVHDLSAAGAGIYLPGRARIPKRFRIVTEGLQLFCHLVWRDKTFIGVEFGTPMTMRALSRR
jgi:hypothetical protein